MRWDCSLQIFSKIFPHAGPTAPFQIFRKFTQIFETKGVIQRHQHPLAVKWLSVLLTVSFSVRSDMAGRLDVNAFLNEKVCVHRDISTLNKAQYNTYLQSQRSSRSQSWFQTQTQRRFPSPPTGCPLLTQRHSRIFRLYVRACISNEGLALQKVPDPVTEQSWNSEKVISDLKRENQFLSKEI